MRVNIRRCPAAANRGEYSRKRQPQRKATAAAAGGVSSVVDAYKAPDVSGVEVGAAGQEWGRQAQGYGCRPANKQAQLLRVLSDTLLTSEQSRCTYVYFCAAG